MEWLSVNSTRSALTGWSSQDARTTSPAWVRDAPSVDPQRRSRGAGGGYYRNYAPSQREPSLPSEYEKDCQYHEQTRPGGSFIEGDYAMQPPPILTKHAQNRLRERGANSRLAFAPGTNQTVVSTVLPTPPGRETLYLTVMDVAVRRIIGPLGSNVKEIQSKVGNNCQIWHDRDAKRFEVTAYSEQSRKDAINLLKECEEKIISSWPSFYQVKEVTASHIIDDGIDKKIEEKVGNNCLIQYTRDKQQFKVTADSEQGRKNAINLLKQEVKKVTEQWEGQLRQQRKDVAVRVFHEIAKSGDGLLSKAEIKKYLKTHTDLREKLLRGQSWAALFELMDTDGTAPTTGGTTS